MQKETPPLVLSFGASDPTGTTGIQADLATFSSFGCHGLTVLTQINVQDTVRREGILVLDAEWVIDQARCLLEDTPALAFKVGDIGSTENVTAIAEIVADYPDLALVLAPNFPENDNRLAAEELRTAIAQLLIPQTSVLVLKHNQLHELASVYFETEDSEGEEFDPEHLTPELFHAYIARLLEVGCEYVLVADSQEQAWQITHSLYGSDESGTPVLIRRDSWDRMPQSFVGKTGTLSAAITALLANGLDIPEAVGEAQEFLQQSLINGFRIGMGRFTPDRLFWTRDDEEEATPASVDTPPSSAVH